MTDDICRVDLATVSPHRQCAELIEPADEYPEPLAWEMAAVLAAERALPVAGPNGIEWPIPLAKSGRR